VAPPQLSTTNQTNHIELQKVKRSNSK
jgi:hypothetical protein